MSIFDDIIQKYQQGRDDANAGNEARYEELISLLTAAREAARTGNTEMAQEIEANLTSKKQKAATKADEQTTKAKADLQARGLGGSVAAGAGGGIQSDLALMQQAADEVAAMQSINNTQAGLTNEIGTTEMLGNAIESRYDIGPDTAQYGSLLSAAANKGAFNGDAPTSGGRKTPAYYDSLKKRKVVLGPGSSVGGGKFTQARGNFMSNAPSPVSRSGSSGRTAVRTFTR